MPVAEQAARNRRREGGGDVVFMGFRGFYRDNQPPARARLRAIAPSLRIGTRIPPRRARSSAA